MLRVAPEVFHNITGLHKTQEALNCVPVSSFTTSSVLFSTDLRGQQPPPKQRSLTVEEHLDQNCSYAFPGPW